MQAGATASILQYKITSASPDVSSCSSLPRDGFWVSIMTAFMQRRQFPLVSRSTPVHCNQQEVYNHHSQPKACLSLFKRPNSLCFTATKKKPENREQGGSLRTVWCHYTLYRVPCRKYKSPRLLVLHSSITRPHKKLLFVEMFIPNVPFIMSTLFSATGQWRGQNADAYLICVFLG